MSRGKKRGQRSDAGRGQRSDAGRQRSDAGRSQRSDAGRSERIVYGLGPVAELIERHPELALRIAVRRAPRGRLADIATLAVGKSIEVREEDVGAIESAAGQGANHQGIVAFAGPYPYAELEDILDRCDGVAGRPIIVLDGVTDPHNLGAICRSAYLLGAAGIVLGRDRAAPVNAVATKASAGATEYLAIAQVTNIARALAEMREAGLWRAQIAATREARALSEIDRSLPWALVMGSEGRGLRTLVARETDFAFAIPMSGDGVGSFNVSVAAALALYELAR